MKEPGATGTLPGLSRRQFLKASGMAALLATLPTGWAGRCFAADAPETPRLRIGIIALTDCSSIVIAYEKGFFKEHGLDVMIAKEASWAVIRDKLQLVADHCPGGFLCDHDIEAMFFEEPFLVGDHDRRTVGEGDNTDAEPGGLRGVRSEAPSSPAGRQGRQEGRHSRGFQELPAREPRQGAGRSWFLHAWQRPPLSTDSSFTHRWPGLGQEERSKQRACPNEGDQHSR